VVVRDDRSPSGWAFRSSYYRAMLAYAKAFEALPSSHRQFHGAGYEELQQLLFTGSARLRPGTTSDSTQSFLARPALRGDTIAFIPYPRSHVLSGNLDMAGVQEGRLFARRVFRDIALRWSSALPRSPATKEAVGIALEMLGDVRAARDTFRAARDLARDSLSRTRLASLEVVAGVKNVLRDPRQDLSHTMALADSLMRLGEVQDPQFAEPLARIAVLTGRCARAQALLQRTVWRVEVPVAIPPSLWTELHALVPAIAMGCERPERMPAVEQALARVGGSAEDRLMSEYMVTGPVLALFPQAYTSKVQLLARLTGDYALAIADSLVLGNRAGARRLLVRQEERRRAAGIGLSTDAALAEARLWLRLGDTTAAARVLDSSFREFGTAQPLEARLALQNAVMLASLVPALQLRVDLAAVRREDASSWGAVIEQLWRGADPKLRAILPSALNAASP
jgi:hypothetical protein